MARRGKTVIGRGEKEQTRLMMQAGAEGTRMTQRATEAEAKQRDISTRAGMAAGPMAFREARATREQEFGEEAEIGRQVLRQRGQDIQAAQAGLEEQPGQATSPLVQRRMDELRDRLGREGGTPEPRGEQPAPTPEQPGAAPGAAAAPPSAAEAGAAGEAPAPGQPPMAAPGEAAPPSPEQAQRMQAQGERPIEMGGQGPAFAPTEAKRQATRQAAETEAFKAITDRMKVTQNIGRARAAGDDKAVKALEEQLENKIKPQIKLLDRFMDGKPHPGDTATIRKWMEGMGGADPSLEQDLDTYETTRQPTARLRNFISNKLAADSLQFVQDTQGSRPSVGMDPTSPMIQMFERNNQVVSGVMASLSQASPQFAARFAGIKGQADKIHFVQDLSAWLTQRMMESPGSGKYGEGLLASQSPSAEQQAQLEAKGQGEAARERGGIIAPADVMAPGSGVGITGGSAGSPGKWSGVR